MTSQPAQIPLQAQVLIYNPGGGDQRKDLFAGVGVQGQFLFGVFTIYRKGQFPFGFFTM